MIKTLVARDLGSLTREVDANVVWRASDPSISCDYSWGVPVYVVREWITDALKVGDYAAASRWSALITPAPVAEPVPVVICSRPLTVGRWQATPERADAIVRERMRHSRRAFERGLAGDFRAAREGGRRRLLPLV